MRILGIETSCDDTGVAIYDDKSGLLANQLHNQSKLHTAYGGVVPELASRDHIRNIVPLIQKVLIESNLNIKEINAVAWTAGPGLAGSLLIGATIGRSIAFALGIPGIPVHHMEGHLLTPMLEKNPPSFPFVALLISGGHTQLVKVLGIGQYTILGETIDDAIGEAFDKIAILLGLGYPGGPVLSKLASKGVKGRFIFPRPMINRKDLNFSFSGLKTFVANVIHNNDINDQTKADIACAFEDAIADVLVTKCRSALINTGFKRLVIAGGVSANYTVRIKLSDMIYKLNSEIFYARPEFCTDNGAMIAYVGMVRIQSATTIDDDLSISIYPRWSLEDLRL